IRLDTSSLSWSGLVPESKLISTTVIVKAGDKSFNALVKPRLVDGKPAPPRVVNWVVPRNVSSIVANITCRLAARSTVSWSRNGQNLAAGEENAGDLFIELIDADCRK